MVVLEFILHTMTLVGGWLILLFMSVYRGWDFFTEKPMRTAGMWGWVLAILVCLAAIVFVFWLLPVSGWVRMGINMAIQLFSFFVFSWLLMDRK